MTTITTLDRVRALIAEALGLPDQGRWLEPETPLFGAMPELDSLAVLDLLGGLESKFAITIEDDEFGSQLFETVGSLVDFVDRKLGSVPA